MINHFAVQGRFVKDPELKYTASGVAYAKFTLAWSQKYKDTENKLFIDCTAWNKTAELIADKFRKGEQILVEGELRTETWEANGEKRSKIALNVNNMHFLGGGSKQAENESSGSVGAGLGVQVPVEDNDLPF